MSNPWGFDDLDKRPPDDPPKVKYHGPHRSVDDIPIEHRRVFGTPPPKESKKPVPPPPPPPGSYHKKPKYWQMRYTSHQQVPNRIAGVMCIFFCGVGYLMHKFSEAPQRWDKRVGWSMTIEEKQEYDKKNELFYNMMSYDANPDDFATDVSGERYINARKADNKIRWDLREVDKNVRGIRDMTNPMDNPL